MNYTLRQKGSHLNSAISELKGAFYQWLGTLSVDEILGNKPLIRSADHVETLMLRMSRS